MNGNTTISLHAVLSLIILNTYLKPYWFNPDRRIYRPLNILIAVAEVMLESPETLNYDNYNNNNNNR
jgi:hypothetical protein